jgi:thiamine-phosphate pyrophosphorylase
VRDTRDRLASARLYLVCDEQPDWFVQAALRGGVDIVQLRMKDSPDDQVLMVAQRYRRICGAHGALFILNDRPDLAVAAGADGVHVGQDDVPSAEARTTVGADRLVGLSTHTAREIDEASGVDYIGVGPVFATPTKPGRPAVGVELVRYAAAHATVPFFAIGGIDATNAGRVRRAGADRLAVVRALTESSDPELAARELVESVSKAGAAVGPA